MDAYKKAAVLDYLISRGLTAVVGDDGLVWIVCNIYHRPAKDGEIPGVIFGVCEDGFFEHTTPWA